jgi:putative hydrolase of the HAD superfamily
MTLPIPRHLSLDLWMTLIRSNPGFKPARNALLREYFGINATSEVITATMQQYDRNFTRIAEITGRHTYNHTMLLMVLQALGVDTEPITATGLEVYYAVMEAVFAQYPPDWCEPDIADTLGRVRNEGITISLFSNTGFVRAGTLRRFFDHSTLAGIFDFQLYSDELGFAKPDPYCFNAILEGVQQLRPLPANAILHVGDNPVADYGGAKAAGMQAAITGEANPIRQILAEYNMIRV